MAELTEAKESAVAIPWDDLADLYGFFGNSLLKSMTQTPTVGLDEAFWAELPDFGAASVRAAFDACGAYARAALEAAGERGVEGAAERASVEYTRLFMGPPSPAAAPWETLHRNAGSSVAFGKATFAMRHELAALGLEVRNENNQYEDHMGIELLCLSELCRRAAAADELAAAVSQAEGAAGEGNEGAGGSTAAATVANVARFMDERPLGWVSSLCDSVAEAFSQGYFAGLLDAVRAVLVWHRALL